MAANEGWLLFETVGRSWGEAVGRGVDFLALLLPRSDQQPPVEKALCPFKVPKVVLHTWA